jgi:hypothetical protein
LTGNNFDNNRNIKNFSNQNQTVIPDVNFNDFHKINKSNPAFSNRNQKNKINQNQNYYWNNTSMQKNPNQENTNLENKIHNRNIYNQEIIQSNLIIKNENLSQIKFYIN